MVKYSPRTRADVGSALTIFSGAVFLLLLIICILKSFLRGVGILVQSVSLQSVSEKSRRFSPLTPFFFFFFFYI